jgi:hypothetical protein
VHGNSSPIEISEIKSIPEIATIDLFTTYKPISLELPSATKVQIGAHSEYGKIKSDYPVFILDKDIAGYDPDKSGVKIMIETTADITITKK